MTGEEPARHQAGVEVEGGRHVAQPQLHFATILITQLLKSETKDTDCLQSFQIVYY